MSAPKVVRLLSPTCRRIVRTELSTPITRQLVAMGWSEYDGPAQATANLDERGPETKTMHPGTRNGWIVPGTDAAVDDLRLARTGARELGYGRGTTDKV